MRVVVGMKDYFSMKQWMIYLWEEGKHLLIIEERTKDMWYSRIQFENYHKKKKKRKKSLNLSFELKRTEIFNMLYLSSI